MRIFLRNFFYEKRQNAYLRVSNKQSIEYFYFFNKFIIFFY